MCSRLYYLGLCTYNLWRSHNDEIAWRRISQTVSPWLSDACLYLYLMFLFFSLMCADLFAIQCAVVHIPAQKLFTRLRALLQWSIRCSLLKTLTSYAEQLLIGGGTALQAGRSRVRFPILSLKFPTDVILPWTLWSLGSTQPLTEMITSNISYGGKGGRYVGLNNWPSSCADCFEICEPQPPGTLRACPGL